MTCLVARDNAANISSKDLSFLGVRKRFTVKSLKDKLTHVKPSITGCGSSGNMSINEAYKIQGAVGKESYAPLIKSSRK